MQERVSQNWPQYHPDYRFLVSGAHRKPAHHLGTPALAFHRAFWRSPAVPEAEWIQAIELLTLAIFDQFHQPVTATELDEVERRERRAPTLSNFQSPPSRVPNGPHHLLRNSWSVGHTHHGHRRHWIKANDESRFAGRYETVQLNAVWQTMPITFRVEIFEEHFTLTVFLSLWKDPRDRKKDQELFNSAAEQFSKVSDSLSHIAEIVTRRYEHEIGNPTVRQERRASAARLAEHSGRIYFGVWESLSEEILSKAFSQCGAAEQLGHVFADFRGLILRHEPAETEVGRKVSQPGPALAKSHAWASLGRPFATGSIEPLCWAEALLPVLLGAEPSQILASNAADSIEYTFSVASQRRCIYGSGFGHQVIDGSSANAPPKERPLTYIILSSHDDHRGIGRFVNRLHTLGTLRLGALQGLRPMIKMEASLAAIRKSLDLIAAQIFKVSNSKHGYFDPSVASSWHPIEVPLPQSIEEQLSKIRNELVRLDATVDDGIAQRTLRSQFLRARFDALVKAMEFERIAGYQPYDQFVAQRMGRAFDRIEAVGARFRDCHEREERLVRQHLLLRADEHQAKIEKIQFWGEVFFVFFVLPYYVSGLISHVFDSPDYSFAALGRDWHFKQHDWTIVVWSLAVIWGVSRYSSYFLAYVRDRRGVAIRSLAWWGAAFLTSVALALFL